MKTTNEKNLNNEHFYAGALKIVEYTTLPSVVNVHLEEGSVSPGLRICKLA